MARNIPAFPDICPPKSDLVTSKFSIDVITPMFGGGTESGKTDEITPIRGSSIRGHLRFWWRATRGAICKDEHELREREKEIFGSDKLASKVSLQVEITKRGFSKACAFYQGDKPYPTLEKHHPAYALFPFLGNKKKGIEPVQGLHHIAFHLMLTYPHEFEQDVMASVWAWINFGGIGARTRRGCGGLYCKGLAPDIVRNSEELNGWYRKQLDKYGIRLPEKAKPWPTMPAAIACKFQSKPHMEAWDEVVGVLQRFRQSRTKPRGRSLWPEPDSIRRITGQSSRRHQASITTSENAFPRAELGLPIIFHFINKDRNDRDPADTELKPIGKQRMASPVIVKPLAINAVHSYPMVLRLVTPQLVEAELVYAKSKKYRIQREQIQNPQFTSYNRSPLAYSAQGSALDAFLGYVRERGFQ